MLGCLLAQAAHAGQSMQDAAAALTSGAWHEDGAEEGHADIFKPDGNFIYGLVAPDGTFTELPGYGGMWIVTGSTVEMSYLQWPERHDIFSLPIKAAGTRGVDEHGHAIGMEKITKAVSVAGARKKEQTAPVSPELQASAARAVKEYRDSIVFVTGSEASGSGFIARDGTATYLITNAHVAAGIHDGTFTALDGTVIRGGSPAVAVGEDLFRMQYPAGGRRFKIMQDVDENISIGDPVVVLGTAEGAGVVNTLIGKIVGIGTDLVEVDAPFVPGNSGSPIIDLKTERVIGVATYMMLDPFGDGGFGLFGPEKVRRFGYRVDAVKTWEPVEWSGFRAQAALMEQIEKRTYSLGEALTSMMWNRGEPPPDGAPDLNQALQAWRAQNARRGKWKQKEAENEKLAALLKNACEADVGGAEKQVTYDYFKRDLVKEKATRDQMEAAIWPAIKAMLQ
jgi:hypothetical protein